MKILPTGKNGQVGYELERSLQATVKFTIKRPEVQVEFRRYLQNMAYGHQIQEKMELI